MPIPLNDKGYYDLDKSTLQDVCNEYSGLLLEALATGGGKSMRSELWSMATVVLQWKEAQDKKAKK